MVKLYFTESVAKKIENLDFITSVMIKSYVERNILGSINPRINAERYQREDNIYRFDLGDFYMYAEITDNIVLINAFFDKEVILKCIERTLNEKLKEHR